MKGNLLLLAALLYLTVITGCSTYRTNSEISFASTKVSEMKPAIHVGEITEGPELLTFLGSVEAEVRRPGFIDPSPTKEQADIVLGYLGKKLDADAVIHVQYRESVTGGQINATGQAVRILSPHSYNVPKNNMKRALEKFGILAEEPAEVVPPATITTTTTVVATPTTTTPATTATPATTPQRAQMNQEKIYAMARTLAETEAKLQAAVEAARANKEFVQLEAENDMHAVDMMLRSATILLEQSQQYSDVDMIGVANRLIQNLQQYRRRLERKAQTGE